MSKSISVKRGVNIPLKGEAKKEVTPAARADVYALKPSDFHGVIPKLQVKEGDEVKVGTPLFADKERMDILFVSPVSGEIAEVVRGDKRKILEVRILADKEDRHVVFSVPGSSASADDWKKFLLSSGLWPFIKMRPYDVIATPGDTPRDIYISGFDSSPLAGDPDVLLAGREQHLQAGIQVLQKLTKGKIYLGVRGTEKVYSNLNGVEKITVKGPHPAGNVGVQIHHSKPLNKGEVVWTIAPCDLAILGEAVSTGQLNFDRIVALTGSECTNPRYVKTRIGARVQTITQSEFVQPNVRIVSGNALTGDKVEESGYLGYYSTQITVLPEGDHKKFLLTEGWLSPGLNKFSVSHAYPSWLLGGKRYRLDTNLNGEVRPFVVTGELEKVFPFDIYPMQLLKSIMVNDVDKMEQLGIYEVAPEDFALCEFACTSKIEIQSVVREGLDMMRKEFA